MRIREVLVDLESLVAELPGDGRGVIGMKEWEAGGANNKCGGWLVILEGGSEKWLGEGKDGLTLNQNMTVMEVASSLRNTSICARDDGPELKR
jgi:hypothetical protein